MGPSEVFADRALDGRVALVTGGGTNLGKAAAGELARCGAKVVIAGRRAEVLDAAAAELGESCSGVAGDIREESEARRIVSAVLANRPASTIRNVLVAFGAQAASCHAIQLHGA